MSDGPTIPEPGRGASPFWTFSLKFYGGPGVPPACLTLQDGAGADVNVVLFCLFLASRGRRLGGGDIAAFEAEVADWRQSAVVPLRHVRRFLKEPPEAFGDPAVAALRDRIKAVELEAERLQQEALYGLRPVSQWGAADAASRATALHNLTSCEQRIGKTFDPAAVEVLLDQFEARLAVPT